MKTEKLYLDTIELIEEDSALKYVLDFSQYINNSFSSFSLNGSKEYSLFKELVSFFKGEPIEMRVSKVHIKFFILGDKPTVYDYNLHVSGGQILEESLSILLEEKEVRIPMFSAQIGELPEVSNYISESEENGIIEDIDKVLDRVWIYPIGLNRIGILQNLKNYISSALLLDSFNSFPDFHSVKEFTEYTDKHYELGTGYSLKVLQRMLPALDLGISRVGDQGEILMKNISGSEVEMGLDDVGSGVRRLCLILPLLYVATNSHRLTSIEYLSASLHPILEEALIGAFWNTVSKRYANGDEVGQVIYGGRSQLNR